MALCIFFLVELIALRQYVRAKTEDRFNPAFSVAANCTVTGDSHLSMH